ncbi:MAG TPA: TetR/AcrR family transcriptional regulator [Phycisphaerales bacterium]|nr:TetR/AcrR family transcriptional regulator [Phycisphaerales bacterium]
MSNPGSPSSDRQTAPQTATQDPRAQQTRSAIIASFNERVLEQPLDAINVSQLAQDAGVGRSTLYEHFRNKDDVLIASMRHMLDALADTTRDQGGDPARVQSLMEHLWENRLRARVMLTSDTAAVITRALAEAIESRLHALPTTTWTLPVPMVAACLAECQIALIRTWLQERWPADATTMTHSLTRVTAATRDSLKG